MTQTMATTASWTVGFSRLLLALAVALVLGTMVVPEVDASKKGKNTVSSVKNRVQSQRDLCEIIGGGTLTVEKVGKATVTDCNGGTSDGRRCVITKKTSACHQQRTLPPPSDARVGVPVSDVGVAEEPPADPRTPPPGAPFLE